MIHVISKRNRHLYEETMEDYFKLRYRVFHDHLGWRDLENEARMDVDDLDTDEALYFLKLKADGTILGGMRIVPTMVPTQLQTIFNDHCTLEEAPRAIDNWEMSRYFVIDGKYRSQQGHLVKQELYTGLIEYALAHGITGLSGFMETIFAARVAHLPWDIDYLGLPEEYDGGEAIAINMNIDEQMFRLTKMHWQIEKPVLSISLGVEPMSKEVGYPAETVMLMESFAGQHPEYLDMVAGMAKHLTHLDGDAKDQARSLVAQWELEAAGSAPIMEQGELLSQLRAPRLVN